MENIKEHYAIFKINNERQVIKTKVYKFLNKYYCRDIDGNIGSSRVSEERAILNYKYNMRRKERK